MKRLLLIPGLLALFALSAAAQQFDTTSSLYSTTGHGVNWRQTGGTFPPSGTPVTQFRGFLPFSAITHPATPANLNDSASYAANAANIGLTRSTNGASVDKILRAAQVGAPFYSRQVAAYFGSIITPPGTTESGAPANADYWRAEPLVTAYTTNTYGTVRYYWSPHANNVFATQAGPVPITWIKATGTGTQPATGTAGLHYTNLGGIYYTLTNTTSVISGAAAKTPRTIFWTEKTFQPTGKPVDVPGARIGAVNIVYNTAVPQKVASEFVAIGQSAITDGDSSFAVLKELRTLWYEQGQIHAYNTEGRIFVELLGDTVSGTTRRHLGYEIVDIRQQPYPSDLMTELGEKIRGYSDAATSDAALNPEPLQQSLNGSPPFLYRNNVNGSDRVEYYATRETANQNDALSYWMEAGVANLRWPLIYARYKLVWPTDVSRYSHYVRPLVATEAEAKLTAVPLPNDNVPAIQYQDALDFPRGKLTETFAYYTFLDASQPAHRGLLRFTAGDRVAFERVFSFLDVNLKAGNFPSPIAKSLGNWNRNQLKLDGTGYGTLPAGNYFNGGSYTIESWINLQAQAPDAKLVSFSDAVGERVGMVANLGASLNPLARMEVTPGWQVKVVTANFNLGSIADTERALTNATSQNSVFLTTSPYITYGNGGTFKLLNRVPFPGLGGAQGNWAIEAKGLVTIPSAGTWTFGVNSDDGFSLTVNGWSSGFNSSRANSDTLSNFVFSAAGTYPIRLSYWNGGGGSGVEVFAASGNHASFAAANGTFRLVGDVSGGGLNVVSFRNSIQSSQPLPLNQWAHLASVYDAASSSLTVYLNGVAVGTVSGVGAPNNAATLNNNIGSGLIGSLDSFRIWSTARTPAQLQQDMQLSSYPAGTAGLQVQVNFDDSGAVALDTSGNNQHMTFVGGVTRTESSLPQTILAAGRYVAQTAYVGDRINAPSGELGSGMGETYLPGYILQTNGNSFHPGAYIDPFVSGFDAAQLGAIIPVNAIPGTNNLDVWWFRPSSANAASSGVKTLVNGFKAIYWPAVIGRYTLAWPTAPSEIVLASNDGSGALPSLPAKGTIYVQNDPSLPGYNPNEEHALMLGGQAYALRDDLNKTAATIPAVLAGASATYSSDPYVLLDYTESDGRPAMRAFKVLREKPTAGIVFDYIVQAGANQSDKSGSKPLQAPMPLPFLPQPVAYVTNGTGASATITKVNYNTEPSANSGDLPVSWASLSDSDKAKYANYKSFTYRDRKDQFWVLRGVHAGLPTLAAGKYTGTADAASISFTTTLDAATAVINQPFTNTFHVSRPAGSLVMSLASDSPALPGGLAINGLTLAGTPTASSSQASYNFVIKDIGDSASVTVTLPLTVVASGTVAAQAPKTFASVNQYAANATVTYTGRPPFLAAPPTTANSFTMRFYYKTQAGFAWPGNSSPPAVGTIVPYLRPANSTADPGSKTTAALDIVYRPVWPGDPPKVAFGETLMSAGNNRPAVRGQTSVQLLYQQAIATNSLTEPKPAVVLHDPTREKTYALRASGAAGLNQLPAGVRTDSYQGRTYFPNLPPHLAQRFFFDPNRGPTGSLVFKGEYKEQGFSQHDWVLLNVLRGGALPGDLAVVKNLCPSGDVAKGNWDAAVEGLTTTLETFYENPKVPGTFIVNTNLTTTVGIRVLAEVSDDDTAVDSYALSASGPGQGYVTMIVGNGGAFTPPADPVSVYVLRVGGSLFPGELKITPSANPLSELVSLQHNADLAGRFGDYEYEWKINPPVDGAYPVTDATMSRYLALFTTSGVGVNRYTLGGAGIQGLVDNYIVMRYRPKHASHPLKDTWSAWTEPQLVEGWIKRVLAGINPFGQRVTDLYNNSVNTDASILTSAGKRWEGDIALNMETINNYGLIEIYETVLRRGRGLSIDANINFGPANDALLLAAGYLNDLYMLVGNEAYADAANPTIGIGTKDNTYGDIATALFAFKGQVPSLLEEELGLLRGRDDFLQPGVNTGPVYNRFVWNYTRGIDAGEVIYALNYNILDKSTDGAVNAADAAILYPQGHGDAYGHYLTAVKGYYSLLLNNKFDWVPRTEAVTILGKAVAVDYLDERKFAAAAAAVARTGRQVFDLTWRKDFPGQNAGWESFRTARTNLSRALSDGQKPVREWGLDQWASRTGQGSLVSWVIGNAILPTVDPDPTHEGIQKIDRTTVPELSELVTTGAELQTAMDNAEGRLTPLGLAQGSLAFDLNPNTVVGTDPQTHFEQVYGRAKVALNNAVLSFDDAKDVTRLMRSEEDSLADFAAGVARQELAYTNSLIELYGTPYPEDIGPGQTYKQGYEGPDLLHYVYVETPELIFGDILNPTEPVKFRLDVQNFPATFAGGQTSGKDGFDFLNLGEDGTNYVEYTLSPHGYFAKPKSWTGRRKSPGGVQQAISDVIKARAALLQALENAQGAKDSLDVMVRTFKAGQAAQDRVTEFEHSLAIAEQVTVNVERANELFQKVQDTLTAGIKDIAEGLVESLPKSLIVGLANGGDVTSPARGAVKSASRVIASALQSIAIARNSIVFALRSATDADAVGVDFNNIRPIERTQERIAALNEMANALGEVQGQAHGINQALQSYDDAQRAVRLLVARGERLQAEREISRQRTSAVIQGFRTRDAAFRIFRNEKLERYKSLFDLASRYSYLAANAYDYETGLLGTTRGKAFVNRIINARALGVVKNGEPQYAGSNTGDPGLSSALAEMKADWDVLKGRLGFNNPDAYGTTASLRSGKERILPGSDGDANWQDVLQRGRKDNLLEDADVRRYCLQIDTGDGLPVPGIVLTFSTTIAKGMNLFGLPLAANDGVLDVSSFATKLFGLGVALEGYRGMQDPVANGTAVTGAGGTSPADPTLSYLDPLALSGYPYIYLIPVGTDSMRSPPLGDASVIRTWTVNDVAIPLPFNIGGSDFSTKQLWQSSDSLTEALFAVRKHQAFRPVATTTAFNGSLYTGSGSLQRSQYTNNRLIGRSVWNSQWKLVIPGNRLLNDPKEGLDRFIQSVKDVKLHFITYSYSGN